MKPWHLALPLALLAAPMPGCSRGGSDDPPAGTAEDLATVDPGGDGAAATDLATSDGARPADLASAGDMALPGDPFEAASCPGPLLDLATKLAPGASSGVLVPYTMKYQLRSCTDFTGCGPWGPATPSWGPSGSGKIYLVVTGSGIIVAVVDNNAGSAYGTPIYKLGMDCTLKGEVWDCGDYRDTEVVEGANFLRFDGKDKFSGTRLPVSGEVRAACARFYGSAKGPKVDGAYKEFRGGFLVRY